MWRRHVEEVCSQKAFPQAVRNSCCFSATALGCKLEFRKQVCLAFFLQFCFFRIFAAVPKLCEVRRLQHISLTPRKSILAKKREAICGEESFLRLNAEPTRRNIRAQGLQSCGVYVIFAVCLIQCTSQTSVLPPARTYSPCTCTPASVVM